MSLQKAFRAVLESAAAFSTTVNPAMRGREDALKDAQLQLNAVLRARNAHDSALQMKVDKGGRQSQFSPTAWIRIYNADASPNAMTGFYLVYLFAADGSRVYLSLNQGTSEWRSNHMRPANDAGLLRERAAEARLMLAEREGDSWLVRASIAMDLRADSATSVSAESRKRIRNYEYANIYAIEYSRLNLPADSGLETDLVESLPNLEWIYGRRSQPFGPANQTPGYASGSAGGQQQRTARYLMDPEMRRALEVFAEDAAIGYFSEWSVRRVGRLRLGYDLDCRRTDRQLHVEVKGTSTLGEEVFLTPNEVRHQLDGGCPHEHALFVLSEVSVTRQPDGSVLCTGGRSRVMHPWDLQVEALSPTQYAYRLSPIAAS